MDKQEGFNFRIPPELKVRFKEEAKLEHTSLNQWLIDAAIEKAARSKTARERDPNANLRQQLADLLGIPVQ